MYLAAETEISQTALIGLPMRDDPRLAMAARLPGWVQPFLTWLTAKPAPGENLAAKSPLAYVWEACGLVAGGCVASAAALIFLTPVQPLFWLALLGGMVGTTSGMGVFQVVVFHHCAHGTVFATRARNRLAGRLVSAILLFKHFDAYRHEHMIHHNANKLFTLEDEFTDFVVGICDLATAKPKEQLWRELLIKLVSPLFHGGFMLKRIKGSLCSAEISHNLIGIGVWSALLGTAILTHHLAVFALAWLLPVTVLLQIATVFRILCEHRLPETDVIEQRGKALVCASTAGVFPGVRPPYQNARSLPGLAAWAGWWGDMLTWQLFVRVFVLVGDAPCHDFHHRRASSKRWTRYAQARQADLEAGCPGYPMNYVDTWGLFRAVDENFAAMERAPAGLMNAPA